MSDTPETVNIRNNRKSLVELPYGTRLLPGENDVLAVRWKREYDNKNTRRFISQGVIEKLEGKAKPHPTTLTEEERKKAAANGSNSDSLKSFTIPQVKDILTDSDDVAKMKAWLGDERVGVKKLVQQRIDELEAAAS